MPLSQDVVVHVLLTDRAKLLAYIRSMVVNPHVAEDIHQDVLVQALEKRDTLIDGDHLLAWARQTARFRAIDWLRRQHLQPQYVAPDVLELLEPAWESEWSLPAAELSDALRECLGHLTPRARKMVSLRFGERVSGEEIAKQVGCKVQSVYMSLSRIYRALDTCIRGRLQERSTIRGG
jgi:RNA polymerase sigma-70 factor, ECF subfamily